MGVIKVTQEQFIMWKKSKNKNYYKVPMLNGGFKYVYMCEEMVQYFYGHKYRLA